MLAEKQKRSQNLSSGSDGSISAAGEGDDYSPASVVTDVENENEEVLSENDDKSPVEVVFTDIDLENCV